MKILIVDNDKNTVETLKAALADQKDIDIEIAYNGQEALAGMSSGAYDLVVLDIMMPGVSGIDVCRTMTQSDRLRSVPVLLISALPISSRDFHSSLEKVDELSVVRGVLEKPFSKKDFIDKIRKIAAGAGLKLEKNEER